MKTIEPIPTLALDDLLSIAASAIEDLLEHTDPNTSYYSGVWADVPGKLRAATMLQACDAVRDLSTPVDPQVAEYEQNVLQSGNSPVIPDGSKEALSEAVAAIYFADSTDYLPALYSVVKALSPEVFAQLLSNEKAAFDATRLPAAPQEVPDGQR